MVRAVALHSLALEQGEAVVVRVLEDREPSYVRDLLLTLDKLRAEIGSLGEGLVDVDYAEVVEESCFAHGLLVEATHSLVLASVLVGNEPIVHVSARHFVELPAEQLLVELSNLFRRISGNLEVHQCVFFWLRSGCGCCFH